MFIAIKNGHIDIGKYLTRIKADKNKNESSHKKVKNKEDSNQRGLPLLFNTYTILS